MKKIVGAVVAIVMCITMCSCSNSPQQEDLDVPSETVEATEKPEQSAFVTKSSDDEDPSKSENESESTTISYLQGRSAFHDGVAWIYANYNPLSKGSVSDVRWMGIDNTGNVLFMLDDAVLPLTHFSHGVALLDTLDLIDTRGNVVWTIGDIDLPQNVAPENVIVSVFGKSKEDIDEDKYDEYGDVQRTDSETVIYEVINETFNGYTPISFSISTYDESYTMDGVIGPDGTWALEPTREVTDIVSEGNFITGELVNGEEDSLFAFNIETSESVAGPSWYVYQTLQSWERAQYFQEHNDLVFKDGHRIYDGTHNLGYEETIGLEDESASGIVGMYESWSLQNSSDYSDDYSQDPFGFVDSTGKMMIDLSREYTVLYPVSNYYGEGGSGGYVPVFQDGYAYLNFSGKDGEGEYYSIIDTSGNRMFSPREGSLRDGYGLSEGFVFVEEVEENDSVAGYMNMSGEIVFTELSIEYLNDEDEKEIVSFPISSGGKFHDGVATVSLGDPDYSSTIYDLTYYGYSSEQYITASGDLLEIRYDIASESSQDSNIEPSIKIVIPEIPAEVYSLPTPSPFSVPYDRHDLEADPEIYTELDDFTGSDSGIFDDDGFVFSDSSDRYLTPANLIGLDPEILGFARNEIFARHGKIFETPKYSEHFSSYTWYSPTQSDVGFEDLNAIERANVELIQQYE